MALVDDLIKTGYLKTPEIINAFRTVRRLDFLREANIKHANINEPIDIGYDQTISQPLTVAFMFEILQPKTGEIILDIGSGSGWTVALLSEIVGSEGRVYGLERIKELKEFGENNLDLYDFISSGRARIFWADGYSGLPEFAPFDKIIVAAAAEQIPSSLYSQLKVGGRLVMPVGKEGESQDLVVVDKIGENDFQETRHPGFLFVPLIKN